VTVPCAVLPPATLDLKAGISTCNIDGSLPLCLARRRKVTLTEWQSVDCLGRNRNVPEFDQQQLPVIAVS
jgi:hypothetical protein